MDSRHDSDRVALGRAASMAERLAAGLSHPDPTGSDHDAGRERLDRWRTRPPFDEGGWWDARLDADGLDEATLLGLLAEPAESVARRVARQAWIDTAVEHLIADSPLTDPPPTDATELLADLPFTTVVLPLLRKAHNDIAALFEPPRAEAAEAVAAKRFEVDRLTGQLYRPLANIVNLMLGRTLVLELELAKLEGLLTSDTSEERFAEFIGLYGTADGRRKLCHDYPVLVRQIVVLIDNWVRSTARIIERLQADWQQVSELFNDGVDPGTVTDIDLGLGERHRGGATVARLNWSSGLELIYKPHSLTVDVHFQQLLAWFNERGVRTPFRTLTVLDRDGYGWVECVRAQPCPDQAALGRFYRRHGGLLAILYLLYATDIHSENLIASGDQPVIVDLETLVHPRFLPSSLATDAEGAADEAIETSVLAVGLLPDRAWAGNGAGIDLSGLGHRPKQRTAHSLPVIANPGTDQARVRLEKLDVELPKHRPVGDDEALNLLAYTDDLVAGFEEIYALCVQRRTELEAGDGPLEAFTDDKVRVIRKATMWYATILHTSYHPDVLRDGLARDRHFDALWRTAENDGETIACIGSERADMWAGDVPYFSARVGGTELYDSRGQRVPGITLVPGIDRVRERLRNLGDTDLERQLWLIRSSMGTTAVTMDGSLAATYRAEPSTVPAPASPVAPESFVDSADRLGHRLRTLAFEENESVQWLGVTSTKGGTWTLGPLPPTLFHGLAGVALFYGSLGELTGDRNHESLARKVLGTVESMVDRRLVPEDGGMAGRPGIAYVLGCLGQLWGDESLLTRAMWMLERDRSFLTTDTEFDFVGGSAGTIAALLALHRIRPDDRLLDMVSTAADQLCVARIDSSDGTGWLSETVRELGGADGPIVGFAHGVSGITWTLFEAASILGADRYRTVGLEALRYEQARYQPESQRWRDERRYDNLGIEPPTRDEPGWCYGAMGIGLSRLLCRSHVPDDTTVAAEIETALEVTSREPYGLSHCLCHGDLGNLELFLQAARGHDPSWAKVARRHADSTWASIRDDGWRCGTPLRTQTPSLMVGLAGIGYGLLRAAAPDRVPAVIALRS